MATVEKRGDSYKITVSCGYDVNNKQIRHRLTWTPDPGMTTRQIEKELDRQTVLFEERCRTGQVIDGNIKFADFAERWFIDYAELNLRPTTVSRYRLLMPRINAAIGHIRLDKLQPHHLIAFYKNLDEEGIRHDGKYRCAIDLDDWIKSNELSRRKFAALAGVCPTVIDCAAQGKTISQRSAERVSEALGASMAKLFDASDKSTKLSRTTVAHHHRLISSILSTAVKWQVILSNPCARVDPPKVQPKEALYLDEYDAARLLEALESESVQHRTIVKLLLYTGMRRGELCGLEWGDVDFERSVLHVRRSSLYLAGKGVFTDQTKNTSSVRSLKLSDDAVAALREQRTWQLKERLRLGDIWQNTDRVFTCWDGKPIRPDVVTGWFSKFVKKHDLPPIHIHSLRHTNATLLIAAGTNLQTVASRLGHDKSTTTQKIYSHAIKSADAAAAETLQDILHPNAKRKKA